MRNITRNKITRKLNVWIPHVFSIVGSNSICVSKLIDLVNAVLNAIEWKRHYRSNPADCSLLFIYLFGYRHIMMVR